MNAPKNGPIMTQVIAGKLSPVPAKPMQNPYLYDDELASSQYCLVPRGDSASCRHLFNSIAAGCVPIIISDAVVLPFADQLDWNRFSVRIPECMVLDKTAHEQTRALLLKLTDKAIWGALHAQLLH